MFAWRTLRAGSHAVRARSVRVSWRDTEDSRRVGHRQSPAPSAKWVHAARRPVSARCAGVDERFPAPLWKTEPVELPGRLLLTIAFSEWITTKNHFQSRWK